MKPVHEEITDLLSGEDDRFSCPKEIRKKAMDFLARREYGQRELIRKLANKGFKFSIVEDEISRLTEDGLQNDARFAEAFVQSRINQGKGPVRIRLDLGQNGIPDGIIDYAIEESGADWFRLAREQRVKKFGHGAPEDFKTRAKQMRFLQYRGFEQEHIQAAMGD